MIGYIGTRATIFCYAFKMLRQNASTLRHTPPFICHAAAAAAAIDSAIAPRQREAAAMRYDAATLSSSLFRYACYVTMLILLNLLYYVFA